MFQFGEELDMLFIGNGVTSKNAWVPTNDEPKPSGDPNGDNCD